MADRRLKIFHTVARLLNFTKAGEQLHMTQPAVTFQIRQLEEQFNTRLFDRTHNKVTLTEAGKQVYMYSERILKLCTADVLHWDDYYWVYIFAFAIGASTTIAEPSLIAVAIKANEVSGGTIGTWGLRIAVAIGVASWHRAGSLPHHHRNTAALVHHHRLRAGDYSNGLCTENHYSAGLRFRRCYDIHGNRAAGGGTGPGAVRDHSRPQPLAGPPRPDCLRQPVPDYRGHGLRPDKCVPRTQNNMNTPRHIKTTTPRRNFHAF